VVDHAVKVARDAFRAEEAARRRVEARVEHTLQLSGACSHRREHKAHAAPRSAPSKHQRWTLGVGWELAPQIAELAGRKGVCDELQGAVVHVVGPIVRVRQACLGEIARHGHAELSGERQCKAFAPRIFGHFVKNPQRNTRQHSHPFFASLRCGTPRAFNPFE
jgi:hypothetical protein